ncbi:MAG: 2,4-dihydroxyhept-2-ene-1,7-dioic acid aldolase, partial [Alphaproteobacteria bacterium]|nr:2,4-dihydroxyhept-2-ene-1,7-dioic acid aldolase [Alphaproteobacteria bacterium]
MRANRLRQIWDEGRAASNFWLTIPSSYVAEAIAHQGWDSATIDLQHGALGASDAYALLTALSTTECVPL